MRTGTSARSRAVCAAWSPVTLGLPQQQSRHTTTRQGTGPPDVSFVGLSGTPVHPSPEGRGFREVPEIRPPSPRVVVIMSSTVTPRPPDPGPHRAEGLRRHGASSSTFARDLAAS
ncbi:hypothetical protein GCM10010206_24710 [Streptomyces cinerochromogenes]|nr:hypothetical protein GCM10010206_24710 [Streptomyces cinerochromogenes]